ncbi:hypothetical protein OE749_09220 [Aestuariibacter sp. AA17]|uniref:STAS/SEC14 domain-containing protein n=1 Tax=Fluctibacter corallii TaxID=2984329 RepID=A0ABT3A864_9ALTE|nr:hypothetical protein [Aestuariibacter sp. AA17]MCV2884875.1 hypothetical protein [Aestuariibacter sp. AA17]
MYAAHGDFSVVIQDDIIEVQLIGMFNHEGTEQYVNKVKAAVAKFDGRPFSMLIDDLKMEGGTPEAYEILNRYNTWLNNQNLVAKALIIDSEVKKFIILDRTPALKNQNARFFKSRSKAIAWLRDEMMRIPFKER